MIHINLLPVRAERRKEFIRKQLSILALSIFCSIAVMGLLYFRAQSHYKQTKSSLDRTNKRIRALAPIIKKIDNYKKQKAEISKKIAVIIDLDSKRIAPVVLLSDLNRQKPEKLWLTELKESGGNLSLSGVAVDNETVVKFLNNLKRSNLLKKAELTMLRLQVIQELNLKKFSINCPVALSAIPEMLKRIGKSPTKISGEDKNG